MNEKDQKSLLSAPTAKSVCHQMRYRTAVKMCSIKLTPKRAQNVIPAAREGTYPYEVLTPGMKAIHFVSSIVDIAVIDMLIVALDMNDIMRTASNTA